MASISEATTNSSSPPNLSFAIRPAAAAGSSSRSFWRSLSLKEHSHQSQYYPSDEEDVPSSTTTTTTPPVPALPVPPPCFHDSYPSTPAHRLSFRADTNTNTDLQFQTTYRCISSVLKKDGQILSIAISNGLLYTGSESNIIRVWKIPEFTECGQLKTKSSKKSKSCMVIALQASSDRVYAAYADSKIRVWRRVWEGVIKHVRLATIPNSSRAYNNVRSYITGKDKMMRRQHLGPITSLAINVSDGILFSASVDKTVKVWRISDFKCMETIQAHLDPINAIVVSDDGVLFTASDDATVRVWRRNFCGNDCSHSLTVTLPAKFSPVKTLTLTTDGGLLYGGCSDGYIHYWLKGWLSAQYQHGGTLQGHTHAVMSLATLNNFVFSASADSTCRVWFREQDGQHTCLAALQGHRGPIRCVAAFSRNINTSMEESKDDGCMVCTGSLDGVLKVWRVKCANKSLSKDVCEYFELN